MNYEFGPVSTTDIDIVNCDVTFHSVIPSYYLVFPLWAQLINLVCRVDHHLVKVRSLGDNLQLGLDTQFYMVFVENAGFHG